MKKKGTKVPEILRAQKGIQMLSVIFQKLWHPARGWMQPWGGCAAPGFFLVMRPAVLARYWKLVTWGGGSTQAFQASFPVNLHLLSMPAEAFL